MKKATLLLSLCALSFASCNKEEKKEKTNKDYLIAHRWSPATVYIDGQVGKFQDCDLDNYYTFTDDGFATENMGSIKCSTSEPAQATYKYSLSEDQKTLTYTQDGQTFDWNSIFVNDTKLTFTTISGTTKYEYTFIAL